MNDKEFEKLIFKLEQRVKELNELKKIFLDETGRNFVPQLYLSPLGPTIPKCSNCGAEMRHVEPGTWRCDCEER